MARNINLYSIKGGQGTSTTAVLLARQFASEGYTVLLVDRQDGDLSALLGLANDGPAVRSASPMVSLLVSETHEIPSLGHDVVIADLGEFVDGFENYLVTLPDYVSLSRAVRQDEIVKKINGVIIVRPADRVLTDRDVANVLTIPHVATIQHDASIARASDAGLLLRGDRHGEKIPFPTTV